MTFTQLVRRYTYTLGWTVSDMIAQSINSIKFFLAEPKSNA